MCHPPEMNSYGVINPVQQQNTIHQLRSTTTCKHALGGPTHQHNGVHCSVSQYGKKKQLKTNLRKRYRRSNKANDTRRSDEEFFQLDPKRTAKLDYFNYYY